MMGQARGRSACSNSYVYLVWEIEKKGPEKERKNVYVCTPRHSG